LKLKLEPRDVAALRVASTSDLRAFDAYLWGRHYWKQRTPESLFRAIEEFEKAIALDPKFARAYAGLGDSYAVLPAFTDSIPALESYSRGAQASRRALELDPSLAEAHAGLGQALYYQHDWAASHAALTRALELDPAYATAHQWMGELLMTFGRFDDAVAASHRAVILEPAIPVVLWTHGYALLVARRFAESEAMLLRAHAMAPQSAIPNLQLAFLYTVTDRPAQAVPYYVAAGTPPVVGRALAHAATAADSAMLARAATQQPLRFVAAVMYARAGMADSAFAALARSIDEKESLSVFVKADPMLQSLRGHPGYQATLRRAGLADDQLREAGLIR
jgi:tetratricopeptide (TPR) repeat protein